MNQQPATPTTSPNAEPRRAGGSALDRFLAGAGDRLNPILVKETRQSLKSRQFTSTFALLLIVAWGWSMFGLAMMGPEGAHGVSRGQDLFSGYYVILAFCLLVIVPYGAFRSLAAEQEERTYEMLTITTLSPAQIVSGKLGSALVQMLIYLSAISPCLAFTYMLRGLDFPTILFVLFYTFLASLGLSLIGLLAGTVTSERHWQVVLPVLWIVGLLLAFYAACGITLAGVVDAGIPIATREFWIVTAAALTAYGSYFALLYLAAAAQLTFASDNRSTRLRVAMLVQYLLFAGWMTWACLAAPRHHGELMIVFLTAVGLHWYVMGTMMIGESPDLSLRVRRRLPESFLGRMFLTWFNPGPGTGYVFSVAGMLGALLLVGVALGARRYAGGASAAPLVATGVVLAYGAAALGYLTIFLGVGLVLLRLARRVSPTAPTLSVLVQVVLVLLACGVPPVIQMSSSRWYGSGYTLMQITNVFWTLSEMARTRPGWTFTPVILLTVAPLALLVFALNLPGIVREIRFVRAAKPWRVAEEDAQQAALLRPPQPVQISPWDVELPTRKTP